MATYPVLKQSYSSTRSAISNVKIEIAADGTQRGQNNYSKTVYNFNIMHPYLTDDEQTSIQSFYDANSDIPFTFNYAKDLENYTLIFTQEPDFNKVTYNRWDVTMKAIGSIA